MIKSLQSLRFIFAIMIFLHHFIVNGKGLFEAGGTCGVSFFIILSGVVMSLGYYDKCLSPSFSYKKFILKRIIRLYPLHLLCLIAFIVLNPYVLSLGGIVRLIPNLLLIQSWFPIQNFYFSGNAVSWCLSDMMFFYISFPLIVKFINKNNNKKLCVISVIILVAYIITIIGIPEYYSHRFLYISPIFRILDFILGIGIYKFYLKWGETIRSKTNHITEIILGIFCLSIIVATIMIYPYSPINFMYSFAYMIPISFLICYFLTFNNNRGGVLQIFNNRLLYMMGEVSFSFYMIHILAMSLFQKIINKLHIVIDWELKLFVYFILISIASLLIFNLYEKPIANYLQKKLLK